MNVKLCDNCNEIAAIEDQDCITLELPYDVKRHFCAQNCLTEYTEKLKMHRLSSKESELREKIEDILGKDKIEQINDMIKKANSNSSIEKRCVYKILMEIFFE